VAGGWQRECVVGWQRECVGCWGFFFLLLRGKHPPHDTLKPYNYVLLATEFGKPGRRDEEKTCDFNIIKVAGVLRSRHNHK